MHASTEPGSNKQMSLRQLAGKNSMLEFLNRRLLKHAQSVSKASTSLVESAGDIVLVNKIQVSTTDQQACSICPD